MGRYTAISQDAFSELQLDAGVLLNNFNIAEAVAGNLGFADSNIICATTGGIKPSCVPTYSDFAEDVDNAPTNLMEFKHLDGWECAIACTSLGTSPELIRLTLGAADIDSNGYKITPRRDLEQTDFSDIWWVGDRADGGAVAIQLKNALSTGGFSLQTTKNGKGQIEMTITGHVSLSAQDEVPMVFYSLDPVGTVSVTGVGIAPASASIDVDETVTLTASIVPSTATNKNVTWSTSNDAVATVSEGVVTGVSAGSATITVTTVDGGYTDTCAVTVTA